MASIDRRRFLKAAGVAGAGTAASALAAPAIAQASPEIRWRMPTSWPKSLDTLQGGADHFVKLVAEATDGKFQIRTIAGGDAQIPALEVTDAVSSGTVEACHTAPYYMWAKDPTFAFGCAVPFGLNGRMQNSWWLEGGGEALMNAFYAKYNIYGLLAGNTMAQMGGWFRKEINTIDDLKGVKMRIAGFAAAVISKLGVAPATAAGHRHLPGAGEGHRSMPPNGSAPTTTRSSACRRWRSSTTTRAGGKAAPCCTCRSTRRSGRRCPRPTRRSCRAAAAQAHNFMVGRYDALNPVALKKLHCQRHAAAPLLRSHPRCLLQGRQRGLSRDQRQERGLQEALGVDQGLPRRPVPVAAAGRPHLRQLHDDPAAQEDAVRAPGSTGSCRRVRCRSRCSVHPR